jgi:rare lipoprotein A (peptidoglycan hydrolase)
MHTVSLKHALSAGLLAALLGMAAPLVAPAARAVAVTGGEASSTSQATSTPSAGTTVAGTPAVETPPAGGSTTSGSTSGGAAPTPGSPNKRTVATWYGPGFYGHTTACGQKLTPKLVGLASRTLRCGTLVRISYRGHLLTAPVLDRGPYGNSGAVWDLTSGAARALEIKETVRIGTLVVGSVPNTPTLGEPFSTTLSPATPTSPSASSSPGASSAPLANSSATTGGASAS